MRKKICDGGAAAAEKFLSRTLSFVRAVWQEPSAPSEREKKITQREKYTGEARLLHPDQRYYWFLSLSLSLLLSRITRETCVIAGPANKCSTSGTKMGLSRAYNVQAAPGYFGARKRISGWRYPKRKKKK